MWSAGSLKVINNDSSQLLQELIADYKNVSFSPSSIDDQLSLLGYSGSNLCLSPISNPSDNAQLISLDDTIVSCQWCPSGNKIYLTLGSDQVVVISKLKKKWSTNVQYKFNLLEGKLIACFPLSTGLLVVVKVSNQLIVGLSENPPEWRQIALIDCIETTESVCFSLLHCDAVLIGTEDGQVYQIELKNPTTLLCDIQQPVRSILNVDNQILIVGKYGKIVLLDNSSKEALVSFAPTTISNCYNSGRQLYLMSSDNQLYSMEIGGEVNYCKVKFVQAFQLIDESVVILTENGTIYQSSLGFQKDTRTRQRTGAEIKPILLEIHRCTDKIKTLNSISEQVRLDIAQLSIALHMLTSQIDRFPIIIKSFTDPNSSITTQRLIISVTNNSAWNLSSSHWAFQICANQTDQTACNLLKEWRTGETIELEHRLLSHDAFDVVKVKISLVFRVIDPRKQPQSLCVFPLSTIELTVLDFFEPALSDEFDIVKNNHVDAVGFCRKKMVDWPIILQRSWHRGFAKWINSDPLQIVLICGSYSVRMTLKEDENNSDKIWILKIETSNLKLLRLLRIELFRLIENHNPLPKSDIIKVPSHVLAHLQSLRGRLNYIRSLSQWDESDVKPLLEEINLVMAKQFSILL